jgi:hypothetical protein
MALVAAMLNLVNELFGPEQTAVAYADSGVQMSPSPGTTKAGDEFGMADDVVRRRATIFFVWMAAFIGLVALIGFVPAIALFIVAYMRFGFGEPWPASLGFAAATTLVCWVVFHWALGVAWPQSLLGDLFPALRASTRLI